jgi:signal transduction histidine kinase
MASILWLLKGQNALESAYRSFADHLCSEGHTLTFLTVSEENPSYDWLNQNISQDIRFVFFSTSDLSWIRRLNENMGLLPASPARVLAWVYDTITPNELNLLEATGVDEVISLHDSVKELGLRLELRATKNYQRSELRRQIRELLSKEARSETTLSQREEFLSVCAHDLRSPLGLIQSSLSLLLSNENSFSNNQMELLERAKRQSEHGIRLVNDLLDVMAYEQGLKPEYQLVDLDAFLKNLYKDYAFQSQQKSIQLKYENGLQGWQVLMDPDRIHQLIQNLLVNAIKFTESGKKIYLNVISFKGRRKPDPPFPMVIVSVRDEGRGIPEEEIQKIFNRFSQIKDYSRTEGRGLGLSVAKQISNLHDGNLWVKSVEGEGSTFFVLFPHVLSEPKKNEKSSTSKQHPKILIAEPQKSQQELFLGVMGRWGFEPVFAKDGVEMITLAYYHQPLAVLVNSALNKLSEEEAAKILKGNPKTSQIPVFYCQAAGTLPMKEMNKSFMDGVLKLPLDRGSFQIAIDAYRSKLKMQRKKAA